MTNSIKMNFRITVLLILSLFVLYSRVENDVYVQLVSILVFLYVTYVKFDFINSFVAKKRSLYVLAFEITVSFLLLMSATKILSYISITSSTNISIEDIVILLSLGYIDLIIAAILKNKNYPKDRLIMYLILALIYIVFEFHLLDFESSVVYSNTIAFFLFVDILIISLINGIELNRRKSNRKVTVGLYQSLTPKKNIKDNPYFDMIQYGIKDDEIKNIAITSVFGGGKSSVIESYLASNDHPKEIRISLSNIEGTSVNKNSKNNGGNEPVGGTEDFLQSNDALINSLQLKIIKHLYYKVNHGKLRKSKYTRKDLDFISFYKILAFCYMLFVTIFIINLSFSIVIYSHSIPLLFIPFIVSLLLFLLLSTIPINGIKLNAKIFTFEIDQFSTPFDKYLEEIVYFFQKTGYELVIIEDLDRFQSKCIFNSLREINILLNECEVIKNKITFIYAINEYLLEEENLTHAKGKFFDLIIPVIPISSNYNSSGYIHSFFDDYNKNLNDNIKDLSKVINIKPSTNLINEASFYISDMRTMKTIFNEYLITINTLNQNKKLDIFSNNNKVIFDKLFSIIIYKNYMPKDYNELYTNNGYVYRLFERRSIFIELTAESIENEISRTKQRIEYLNFFGFNSVVFQEQIKKMIEDKLASTSVRLNVYDSATQTTPKAVYAYSNASTISVSNLMKSYVQFLNNGKEYLSRMLLTDWVDSEISKDSIMRGTIRSRHEITIQLEKLNREIRTLKYKPFKDIIKNLNNSKLLASICTDENKTCVLPIVLFLIKKGYISEDYAIYMNYFVEGKRSINDELYIQAYHSGESMDPNLVLSDIEGIIMSLKTNYQDEKAVVNYYLMDYLVDNGEFDLFDWFVDKSCEKNTKDLLIDYLLNENRLSFMDKIINYLMQNKSHIVNNLINTIAENDKDDYKKEYVLRNILIYSSCNDIGQILDKQSIAYINTYEKMGIHHAELKEVNYTDNFNNNLLLINAKIHRLSVFKDDNNLLEFIYNNNLYDINIDMMSLLMSKRISKNIYPSMLNIELHNLNEMKSYVIENKLAFVDNILLNSIEIIQESSDFIVTLLNNLTNDQKKANEIIYSANLDFSISDINSIHERYWTAMLINNRVQNSSENLTKILLKVNTIENHDVLFNYASSIQMSEINDQILKQMKTLLITYMKNNKVDYEMLKKMKSYIDIEAISNVNIEVLSQILINNILDIKEIEKTLSPVKYLELVELFCRDKEGLLVNCFVQSIDNFSDKSILKNFILEKVDGSRDVLIFEYKELFNKAEIIKVLLRLMPEYTEKIEVKRNFSAKKADVSMFVRDLCREFRIFTISERKNNYMFYFIS